jgi:hypothetical protein
MYKLIGYDNSTKGVFKSNSGEEISYNNRILKFVTDEVTPNIVGWDCVEFKIKRVDLSHMLGCADSDETVDSVLNSVLDCNCNVSFVVSKGNVTLNAIHFIKNQKG